MSKRRILALHAAVLLALAIFAEAASRNNAMHIKVLASETRALSLDDNGVAKNCDQVTFDAYCRSTRTAPLVNTLLVQDGDAAPFRVSCTAESKFSHCTPLPKGSSFDARREKKGIVVYYVDDQGKLRSQLYSLVTGDKKPLSAGAPAANAARGSTANTAPPAGLEKAGSTGAGSLEASSTEYSSSLSTAADAAPASAAPASRAASTTPPAAPASGSGPPESSGSMQPLPRPTVKCSFTSAPSGAEVTVDGRYVGSTPSVVGLTTGTHVVVISTAGFQQWKRELSVSAGSELTVNAVLQKAQ